jgi:hypothetical protein
VFLGYSSSHLGYHCLYLAYHRIYVSRHVRFHENIFPFANSEQITCCYPIFDPGFDKFSEKSKNREKQQKSKTICFLIYFCHFSIFSIVSKEFKFSKILGTRSTFNALFLQITDLPH